jgi:hypothetical protein
VKNKITKSFEVYSTAMGLHYGPTNVKICLILYSTTQQQTWLHSIFLRPNDKRRARVPILQGAFFRLGGGGKIKREAFVPPGNWSRALVSSS